MNYKKTLAAVAATVTLGLAPALTSVNAATTPKATSTYWTKDVHQVNLTKNVKVNNAKLVNNKGIVIEKSTKTLKKGVTTFVKKSNGAWMFFQTSKSGKVTYYVTTDKKYTGTTNWLKVSTKNSTTTKQPVTVKGAYKTASSDAYVGTSTGTAYLSPASKAYTSNGVTVNPMDSAQVKVAQSGDSIIYQIQMGDKTVTVPQSSDLTFLNDNVYGMTTTGSTSSSANNYISKFTPDSSSAVVPTTFKATSGSLWYVVDGSSDKTPKNVYIYQAASNNWVKTKVVNNTLEYVYK
ncbi:hypothetical protein MOO44_04090 [Nicoliella spurrieriana]|uniref:Surface layer protein A domain-containing protein n=1 Tax=Nicoliella spurrieriana TaxID=2925830 RepID=A0A976RT23_9LACO|nr:hypothetical protein [Nicoliella spurrieriana]UQS87340.1 hypothetical protein MOO44_04090 [Nicoliella spurrieriana]